MNQKTVNFNLGDLAPIALTFVVVGIVLVYGIDVVSDVRDDFTDTASQEYQAGNETVTALAKIPDKLPLIATVAVAAIIIGLIFRFFMNRR